MIASKTTSSLHRTSSPLRAPPPSHPHHRAHQLVTKRGSHFCPRLTHHNLNPDNNLLDEMLQRSYTLYNSTIRTHTANKRHTDAVSAFNLMHRAELRPDSFALSAVLKSSSTFPSPSLVETLHAFATKLAYDSDLAVQKALVDTYARFNKLDSSCRIFNSMSRKDSVSYNILLSGFARAQRYAEATNLFCLMHSHGDADVEPTTVSLAVVLPVCAKLRSLKLGQSLHCYSIKRGLEAGTLVGNALLSMYAKCGGLMNDARLAFDLIGCKDVVSWNSLIAGLSENGYLDEAFNSFREMLEADLLPNCPTIASVLPICANSENGWWFGREIHCYLLRVGLEMDISVSNALLTHYARIGDMRGAALIFNHMHSRDIVTWNATIAGYAANGWLSRAMESFYDLLAAGMKPDSVTLISILPVCAQLRDIEEGRRIHEYILQHSLLARGTSVCNALISFYGKCGDVNRALDTFKGMLQRDLISWNAMLNAFSESGQWEKVTVLFKQMTHEGVVADSITITSVLQACTSLMFVGEAHGYSLRAGFSAQTSVGNAVIDAYTKCGSIEHAVKMFENMEARNVVTGNTMISGYLKHGNREDAEKIFNRMLEKDLTTWNLMLQAYATNGCLDLAFSLFEELQGEGMRPDTMSIMSILAACVCLASVRLVRECHGYTIRSSLDDLHLKAALLDAYSKCGTLRDASILFQTCTKKDLVMFTAMIRGFAMHGMAVEAIHIFYEMLHLDIKPDHVIFTTLLSACSHTGLVNEGQVLFKSIREVHGIEPTMEHYACMVDLLSRRGRLKEAYNFVKGMPCEPNANVWGTLLGSCKTHGKIEIGRIAADRLFSVEDENIGNYVVMSNIYAADGRWAGVEKLRRLMKSKDLKKPAGCSWIEVADTRHVFVACDSAHPQRSLIYDLLVCLDQNTRAAPTLKLFTLN